MEKASTIAGRYALGALAVTGLLAVFSYAFAGWLAHAPAIFLTLAETGLSFCL